MVDMGKTVVGKGADGEVGRARLDSHGGGFNEGEQILRNHGKEYARAFRTPANILRMAKLINDDMREWPWMLVDASMTAGAKWMVPSAVDSLQDVPVPSWDRMRSYVNLGWLLNAETQELTNYSPNKRALTKKRLQVWEIVHLHSRPGQGVAGRRQGIGQSP